MSKFLQDDADDANYDDGDQANDIISTWLRPDVDMTAIRGCVSSRFNVVYQHIEERSDLSQILTSEVTFFGPISFFMSVHLYMFRSRIRTNSE